MAKLVYDEEKARELAKSLEQYFGDPDNLWFESWMRENRLHSGTILRVRDRFAWFNELWMQMANVQASRLLEWCCKPKTDKDGRSYYRINPKLAMMVLQSKHGYSWRADLSVAPADDPYRLAEAARQKLEAEAPQEPDQRRAWLQRQLESTTDVGTKLAVAQLLEQLEMAEQAKALGPALVDG